MKDTDRKKTGWKKIQWEMENTELVALQKEEINKERQRHRYHKGQNFKWMIEK